MISAGLYFADKKYGFNDTFYLTVVAVALYFAISGVYWYYTSSSEFKNINYVGYTGEKSKKSKITVAAWTTKFEPIYNVKIVVGEGKSKEVINTGFEFMKLFDGMGFYQEQELTKLIKAEIEKVTKKNL